MGRFEQWVFAGCVGQRRHRFWHLAMNEHKEGALMVLTCRTCHVEIKRVEDDGIRCAVCGAFFCDPMDHH